MSPTRVLQAGWTQPTCYGLGALRWWCPGRVTYLSASWRPGTSPGTAHCTGSSRRRRCQGRVCELGPNLARTLLIAGIYSGGPRGHCHRGHERRRAVLRGRCGVDDTAVTGVAAVTLVTDDTNPRSCSAGKPGPGPGAARPPPPTHDTGRDSVKSAEKSGLGVD